MIIETILAGLMVAFIRGGKFKNLSNLRFKYWYLVILGFSIQQLPGYIGVSDGIDLMLYITSYVLIIIPLMANLRVKGVYPALLGTLFNAVVIIANGGMMPVSKNAILATGYDKTVEPGQLLDKLHFVTNDDTKFAFLSDFIPLAEPYPFHQVLSIGDLLLCAGLFIFIQHIFVRKGQGLPKEF